MQKRNLTEGPILKTLVSLAIPIILTNILHTVYQLTDTFWVGRLGKTAVAAVSLSFPMIFLLMTFAGGLTIAGSILVAQYKGRNDLKSVNYITGQSLIFIVVVAIVLSLIGYYSSEFFIQAMNPEFDVQIDAVNYLQISFVGIPFMFIYFVFQSVMRGIGNVKIPLYIVLLSVLLNFFLDPLFILGWGNIPAFGVSGAAVATISTEGLSALIGMILLFIGKHGIDLRKRDLIPDFKIFKKIFMLGLPASIEQGSRALSMVIITFLIAVFGTIAIASYGLGSRVLGFIIIPAIGFSMATSTVVGQNIGAGKKERALKTSRTSIRLGFISLTIIGILTYFFAENIAALFIPDEPEVILESARFIKMISFSFGFIGALMGIIGTLRGSGNTKTAMLLSIFNITVLVLMSYILSQFTYLSYLGIWLAFPISNLLGAILGFLIINTNKWVEKEII